MRDDSDLMRGSWLTRTWATISMAIAVSGLSVLGFTLVALPLVSLRPFPVMTVLLLPPAAGTSAVLVIVPRMAGTWLGRIGPVWTPRALATLVGSVVFVVGSALSNVLLVDLVLDRRTIIGYALSLVAALVALVGCLRLAKTPPVRSVLAQRWREALLATAIAVGVGATLIDACCFPHSFHWAHVLAILLALAGFASASVMLCASPVLGARGRKSFRALGSVSLVVVIWGLSVATRPAGLESVMRSPSAGRTMLITGRALLDRDGDGYSAWLAGGDCDDDDPKAFPLSTIGRDCLGLVPDRETLSLGSPHDHGYPAAPGDSAPRVIVLVTIDAFRCGFAHGERTELSDICPHLTELAGEGLIEKQARARAPHTLGSLSSIMAFRGDGALDTLPAALRKRGYRTEAITTHRALLQHPKLHSSFDKADESLAPTAQRADATSSEEVTTRALERVSAESGRPLFLWVHYYDTHHPYVYEPGSYWTAPHMAAYVQEVKRTDRAIGRLTSSLKQMFPNGELALLVTADHGEEFGEHGGSEHARTLYEEVIRVPFLAWRTGSDPRRGFPASLPAGNIDMAPYIMSVVTGAPFARSETLLMNATPPHDAQLGIVNGNSKYIIHYEMGYEELFDLRSDPGETRDLSTVTTDERERLRRLLGEFLRREQQAPATL